MTVTLAFADGRTFTVPKSWPDVVTATVVGLDEHGYPMANAGTFFYGLTLCCGASFTGTEDGVACRSCYALEPDGADVPWGEVTPLAEDD